MAIQVSICAAADLDKYAGKGITHLLSIDNPGFQTASPPWLKGPHKHVFFHDILSLSDDLLKHGRKAPTLEDMQAILDFGATCIREAEQRQVHILVHCTQGASRSPAAAFAIMALALGRGREEDALEYVMERREGALPNILVVKLADKLLAREGQMVQSLKPVLQEANDVVREWEKRMKDFR